MAPLLQIALLVLFMIIIFAIIGLEFLNGVFHNACKRRDNGTKNPSLAVIVLCSLKGGATRGHMSPIAVIFGELLSL